MIEDQASCILRNLVPLWDKHQLYHSISDTPAFPENPLMLEYKYQYRIPVQCAV